MTTEAVIFMIVSWGAVLGLTGWAFARLLRSPHSKLPPPGETP